VLWSRCCVPDGDPRRNVAPPAEMGGGRRDRGTLDPSPTQTTVIAVRGRDRAYAHAMDKELATSRYLGGQDCPRSRANRLRSCCSTDGGLLSFSVSFRAFRIVPKRKGQSAEVPDNIHGRKQRLW